MKQQNVIPSWDELFLNMAKLIATKSKDPSTKVGAVLVRNRTILGLGYNGFPRRVEDAIDRLNNRSIKMQYTVHAEENAILNCAREGISTIGCDLYITHYPCVTCAKFIIQAGVMNIHVPTDGYVNGRPDEHEESFKHGLVLFDEAGITLYKH